MGMCVCRSCISECKKSKMKQKIPSSIKPSRCMISSTSAPHKAMPAGDANGFVATLALAGLSVRIVTRCSSSNGLMNGFVVPDDL